jgi:hypothetical protein
MGMVLTECEVWSVMVKNKDDGLYDYVSYWTNHGSAIDDLKKRQMCTTRPNDDFKIVTANLFFMKMGERKVFYKVDRLQSVMVDAPTRESILAKLTDDELAVLGVKR